MARCLRCGAGNEWIEGKVASSIEQNIKKISIDPEAFRLSELLFHLIKKRNPDHKPPNMKIWAKHVDFMIRIDGRKPTEIEKIIRASQADGFWYKNILSTIKLREKFDRLKLELLSSDNSRTFEEIALDIQKRKGIVPQDASEPI